MALYKSVVTKEEDLLTKAGMEEYLCRSIDRRYAYYQLEFVFDLLASSCVVDLVLHLSTQVILCLCYLNLIEA